MLHAIKPGAGGVDPGADPQDLPSAEDALHESRYLLAEAQAMAHLGTWIHELSAIRWSDECYRIYGLSPGSRITTEVLIARLHPDDAAAVIEATRAAVSEGVPYESEHRIVRPDGDVRWVHKRGKVIRDRQGEPLRMIGVMQDVTDSHRSREERRRAEASHKRIEEELRRAQASTGSGAPAVDRGTETILLVDDEDQVRGLARTVLKRNGYQVLEARSGAEALTLSERSGDRIELLLTDVIMPGITGRQLAQELGRRRPEMKVLYMSGYTADYIVHHGVLDAGLALLPKPFTPESILRKVREALVRR